MTFDTPDISQSHAGQRVWSFVEQELLLPWFYVQVARKSGLEVYASMLMMYHAHELKQFIDAYSNRVRVEQVHLVTPPHVNGQSIWLMEPLTMVGIAQHSRDGSHFLVYQVESGAVYSLSDEAEAHQKPSQILFSSERDIRK